MQTFEVYSLPTLIWKARSGTLFCSAETSVYVLYVDPAPAVGFTFSGLLVTFGFLPSTPYLRLTPKASTLPVFGSIMSVTATALRLFQVENGIAACTWFWMRRSRVV